MKITDIRKDTWTEDRDQECLYYKIDGVEFLEWLDDGKITDNTQASYMHDNETLEIVLEKLQEFLNNCGVSTV